MSTEEIVGTLREAFVSAGKPWVLFENGTFVLLEEPQADPARQAVDLLRRWGPVKPRGPFSEFQVFVPPGVPGWFVTSHHEHILTFVARDEVEAGAKDAAVGQLGRSKRGRDATDGRVVHVEDPRGA